MTGSSTDSGTVSYSFNQLSESQQTQAILHLAQRLLDELLVGTLIFPDEDLQNAIDQIKVRYLMVAMTDEQLALLREVRTLLEQARADPQLRQSKSFRRQLRALGQRPEARVHLQLLRQARPWQFYQLVQQTELTTLTGRRFNLYQDIILPLARKLALTDRGRYRLTEDGVELITVLD